MGWDFVASNDYHDNIIDFVTLTKPTGTVEGDIMYVALGRGAYTAEPTVVPTDWVKVAFDQSISANINYAGIYRKVAGASEPSSYTWEWAQQTKTGSTIVTFRDGFDGTSPQEDVVSNTGYVVSNTTARAAGVTVSASNSPAIFFAIQYSAANRSATPPSGFTEHYDSGDSGSDFWMAISSDLLASGASGDIDATLSDVSVQKHAFMVVLNPAVVEAAGILAVIGL